MHPYRLRVNLSFRDYSRQIHKSLDLEKQRNFIIDLETKTWCSMHLQFRSFFFFVNTLVFGLGLTISQRPGRNEPNQCPRKFNNKDSNLSQSGWASHHGPGELPRGAVQKHFTFLILHKKKFLKEFCSNSWTCPKIIRCR